MAETIGAKDAKETKEVRDERHESGAAAAVRRRRGPLEDSSKRSPARAAGTPSEAPASSFCCEVCGVGFTRAHMLERHTRVHSTARRSRRRERGDPE